MSWLQGKSENQRTFGKSRSTSASSHFGGSSVAKAPGFEIAVDEEDNPFIEAPSSSRQRASTFSAGGASSRGLRAHNENASGKISPVNEKFGSNAAVTKPLVKRKNSYKAEDNKEVKKKKEARTASPVTMAPSPVQGATPGVFGLSGM